MPQNSTFLGKRIIWLPAKKVSSTTNGTIFEQIYEFYDDKNVQTLSVLYLEFFKDSEKVPHSILVAKLRNIGLGIQKQDIMQDYLTDRMQFVKINKSSSTLKEVTSGVPQGSILGPLLLIIFINDIPNEIRLFWLL